MEESPLEPPIKRIWTVFIFLCINIAVLNVVSGQPIFVFMPALATLSSFAFTFLTAIISPRFTLAGLTMFVTGILMAKFRAYEFVIYGVGWLIVLETMSVIFWLKRDRWIVRTPNRLTAQESVALESATLSSAKEAGCIPTYETPYFLTSSRPPSFLVHQNQPVGLV
jgi:hypothetical protein